MSEPDFTKISMPMLVSKELFEMFERAQRPSALEQISLGHVLSGEEQKQRHAQHLIDRADENARAYEAIRALDAVTEPIVRMVLDHHQRVADHPNARTWECRGCDAYGYETDATPYPCSTTQLIAEHIGVPFPKNIYDVDRPEDGSMDAEGK